MNWHYIFETPTVDPSPWFLVAIGIAVGLCVLRPLWGLIAFALLAASVVVDWALLAIVRYRWERKRDRARKESLGLLRAHDRRDGARTSAPSPALIEIDNPEHKDRRGTPCDVSYRKRRKS